MTFEKWLHANYPLPTDAEIEIARKAWEVGDKHARFEAYRSVSDAATRLLLSGSSSKRDRAWWDGITTCIIRLL
jgi:hypothetical protein